MIYTEGDYNATVTDDWKVEVTYLGTLIDNPGPWSTLEGAQLWAQAIVGDYSINGHRQA
jgi:hypothetical protein